MEMVEEVQNQPAEITLKRNEFDYEEEDRISPMLDCLILEIISRLPTTKEAIRTGTLSKRWQHLWPSVPNLIFYNPDLDESHSPSDFFSSVEKTITQCRQVKLKKFELNSTYKIQFESLVNSWIRFAINCNVEELNIILGTKETEAVFVLDELFFISSSFTHLRLRDCILNPTSAISWNKLTSLSISYAKLVEDLIQNILSGSPLLETLKLDHCYGYRRLNITSKSVKNLVLCAYMDPTFENVAGMIEINAPNIMSLSIQNILALRKLVLLNVSSLVKSKLNYRNFPQLFSDEENEELLKGLIPSLGHVKELTIGKFCQEVKKILIRCLVVRFQSDYSNLTN